MTHPKIKKLVDEGLLNQVDARIWMSGAEMDLPTGPLTVYVPTDRVKHEHRYAVFYAKCTSDRLALVCATGTDEECTEIRFIPNLSPFVVPE